MARPALNELAITAFRERLSELALRRFAEDGYASVSLRGLARELGVSHAMIYSYVADKDDLFMAVRLRAVERFVAYQGRRLQPIDDPREALREGARSYVDFAAQEPHAFRVMFDMNQPELVDYPALARAHRQAFKLLEGVVRRAITARVVAGDPVTVTKLLWASAHGVATLQLTGQPASRRSARALAEKMADVMLAGLAPGTKAAA